MTRHAARPFCECGHCDSTGRDGQGEVRLPMAAWAVAGSNGDNYRGFDCLAVHPDHVQPDDTIVQRGRGWVAVGIPSRAADSQSVPE